MKIPEAELRLITGDIGGSYGLRGSVYPEIILMLWAVITMYRDLVAAAFFAAFVITVLLNRVAFMVPAPDAAEADKIDWK